MKFLIAGLGNSGAERKQSEFPGKIENKNVSKQKTGFETFFLQKTNEYQAVSDSSAESFFL